MARSNVKDNIPTERLRSGAVVPTITPFQSLKRSVMSCMLWEKEFYEGGKSVADRIKELVSQVDGGLVAALAIEARISMKLRHVPLMLVSEMARHPTHRKYIRQTLQQIIQRADELAEFLAIYWKDGGGDRKKSSRKLAKSVQRGLADTFGKFSAYDLAKYNQDNPVKLRDVLFLSHARPVDERQDAFWKQLIAGTLETPDTWETAISATHGVGKKDEWERLLREKKLGALALIRNLRNMEQANVDAGSIRGAIREMKTDRVLPFRFIAAAQAAPRFEPELSDAMLRSTDQLPKLPGTTVLIVDVSGSMYSGGNVSARSDMNRAHAACALGAIVRETCEHAEIYATAGSDSRQLHQTQLVPARRGLALVDAIYKMCSPLGGGGIFLKQCMDWVNADRHGRHADRVIVITDGQDTDRSNKGTSNVVQIAPNQYIINVASSKNGIGYGAWTSIDGWSERVLDYIAVLEGDGQASK